MKILWDHQTGQWLDLAQLQDTHKGTMLFKLWSNSLSILSADNLDSILPLTISNVRQSPQSQQCFPI